MIEIWHNPRCSKSRQTLQLLRDHGVEPVIRLYLLDGPDLVTLRGAAKALGVGAIGMMRTKDALFKELGLTQGMSDDALFDAMVANPSLIERPIVFNGDRAAIGRPPDSVLEIL